MNSRLILSQQIPLTMPRTSTQYYRDNKRSKRVVHQCPHCSYQSTGPKIQLTNHVNAKHVPEAERPYQCRRCTRGFAQRAHLEKHMARVHDEVMERRTKAICMVYQIEVAEKVLPRTKKTRARQAYYTKHATITSSEINNKEHEYLPGLHLKTHDIHYDAAKQFIVLRKYPMGIVNGKLSALSLPVLYP